MPERRRALLKERLAPRSKVLDLGCGAGVPLTSMLAETFDLTGVDISTHQIELARQNVRSARFIKSDIAALEFPPAVFDAAVASYSFIHVPREHESLFRKIAGWLRPGGLVLANFGTAKSITKKIGSVSRCSGQASTPTESAPLSRRPVSNY